MWLITIYPESDRDDFKEWMSSNGHLFREFDNIPRLFETEEVFDHPAIQIIEDGDWGPTEVAARQEISVLPDFFSGPDNWGLARLIRRKLPWSFGRRFAGLDSWFEAGLDGAGVDIYVIDSGVNANHDDFSGRAVNVANYADGSNLDHLGHGTACGSLAGGLTVGPARGSLLWSFKCIGSNNVATTAAIVNAINGVISHYNGRSSLNRAAVANLSLSGTVMAIGTATEALVDAGIVTVVAAGNEDVDASTRYPANTSGVICIGGSNPSDTSYYAIGGSNWGTKVDVLAPGQGVRVADHTGNSAYKSGNGTSYSCGFASGVVACLLTGQPRLTKAQSAIVRQYVIDSATVGEFTAGPASGPLPDRLIYLDPTLTSSPITL